MGFRVLVPASGGWLSNSNVVSFDHTHRVSRGNIEPATCCVDSNNDGVLDYGHSDVTTEVDDDHE